MTKPVPIRLAAVAAAAGCLLLAGCSSGGSGSVGSSFPTTQGSGQSVGVTTYPVGQRSTLPDISGPTLDGGQLSLSSLAGHVVVLNVWASWCGPCRQESPQLARVARSTAARGVRFVGIDEQDQTSAAQAFATQAGATYPHLVDQNGSTLASLRLVPANGIPSTLVIDRDGRVAARVIGPVTASTLSGLLKPLVAQQ